MGLNIGKALGGGLLAGMGGKGGDSKRAINALYASQQKAADALGKYTHLGSELYDAGLRRAGDQLNSYTGLSRYNPLFEYLSTGVATPEAEAILGGKSMNAFINDNPAYQYQQEQSEKAINRAAAGRGMWNSSYAGNALADNARALAASNYGDYYNRLAGIYNTGLQANNALANYAYNTEGTKAQLWGGLGRSLSGVYTGMGQEIAGGIADRERAKTEQSQALMNMLGRLGGMAAGYSLAGPMGGQIGGQLGGQFGSMYG